MPKQFIFIMTDTQRKDMVGCYGNKDMKTPNLDKLGEEGIIFENAYTTQPVCGPARSAIFTGVYPHSNGMWTNSVGLDSTVKTIGKRIKDKGILNGYIGKYHLDGGDYFGNGECPEEWNPNYWYDMRNYLEELTEEERVKSRIPSTAYEGDGYSEEFTFAHRCSNKAIDFIKENKDNDFLLVVSYDEPHHPFICPKEYIEMYKDYIFPKNANVYDNLQNKPEHQKIWAKDQSDINREELQIKEDIYFASNTFVDYEIGRVLDAYREYTSDALVCYTSDHGDHLYSHQLDNKGASMYQEIVNIPFILSGKSIKDTNVKVDSLVSHIDIVPTILDYFGIEKYKMMPGKSLIPLVNNSKTKINDNVFIEFGRYEIDHDGFGGFQPIRCTFDGRYKLVINLLSSDELYDLKNDPSELVNLIEDESTKSVRDKLHNDILNWMNATRDPFRGYYWEQRPWRKDAVEATWAYTGGTRQREEDYDEKRQLDYVTGLTMEKATRIKIKNTK